MKTSFALFAVLLFSWVGLAQQPDSLALFLSENKQTLKEMVGSYQKITFGWKQILATIAGLLVFIVLAWKLFLEKEFKIYVRKKAEQAIDKLNDLKTARILVLSNGSEDFLKSFFKTKGFPNCKFIQVANAFVAANDFDYEIVFANNDGGGLSTAIIRQYVKADNVLFYFGKTGTWDFANDTPELSRKINFANSRAQIYGNLMSSLEFLELIKPKIKNA